MSINCNNISVAKMVFILVSDLDECALIPNLCLNGECINTVGSFYCQCKRGYRYEEVMHICEGEYREGSAV